MHTHTWFFQPNEPEMSEHYLCACGKHMFMLESERRLNAVEKLSAEQAREIADDLRRWDAPINHQLQEPGVRLMLAYARILEGKTTDE